MAVNEEIISQFEIILSELLELSGAAENTRIDFNLEVVDASPSAPLTNYVIVSGGPGGTFNGPALKVPGLTYATGDKVNVIFKKGTEPVAMQQGSASSGTNAGLWTKVSGTDNIYYDDGNVSIGFDQSGDTLLHILSQSGVTNDGLTIEKYGAGSPLMQFRAAAGTLASPQELGLGAAVAQWDFYGYEGTTPGFSLGARMSVTLDDAISGTEAPMRFRFFTHRTGVGLTEALRIAAAGNVESDLGYVFIGDEDSGVFYQGVDNWTLEAGGVTFVELTEDTQDTLEFGTSANDIDMSFYYNGGTALSIAGDTGNTTFGTDVSILGGLIVNENSADEDVRFESNGNANMFFMDGGNDVIILGGSTQQTSGSTLEIHDTGDGYVTLYNSGDTSAERGMYLRWHHSNGLGAQIGALRASGDSDGMKMIFATEQTGGSIEARMYISNLGTGAARVGINEATPLGLSTTAANDTVLHLTAQGDTTPTYRMERKNAVSNTNRAWAFGVAGNGRWFLQDVTGATNYILVDTAGFMTLPGSLMVGSATGGNKGVGTANFAADIYKNNSAYTNPDYALEYWATGKIERFKDKPGAMGYRRLDLDEMERYIRQKFRLPRITDEPAGAFERGDIALEKIEELYTYIIELHQRVRRLENSDV